MKNNYIKYTFWFYNIVYIFFIMRVFVFKRGLGYGLGDLFYIILFTIFFLLQLLLFQLFLYFKVKNRIALSILSILNIIVAVFILLKIYVFYGIEVSYEWEHNIWKW